MEESNDTKQLDIASGLRATGICPFNRSAIKIPSVYNVSDEKSPILKATRLAYVPFISPAHPQKANNGEVEKPFTGEAAFLNLL